MLSLRAKHGAAGYGIYWMVMEYLRNAENYMCAVDYGPIAYDLHESKDVIQSVVEDYGLFSFCTSEDGVKHFYSEELTKQMSISDSRAKAGKKAMSERWNKESDLLQNDNKPYNKTDNKSDNKTITNPITKGITKSDFCYGFVINGNPPTPPFSNEFTSENKDKKETPFKKGVEKEEKKTSAQAPPVAEASSATLPQKKEVSLPAKKKTARPPTSERARAFYDRLVPYVGKYSREMIRAFYDYWSEANTEHSQMRFEKQPTFNLAMRLATWSKREKQYEDDRTNKYRSAAEQKREAHDYAISGLEADIRKLQDGTGAAEELPDYILAALRPDQMGDGT
jgi:hypothetical protein